MTFKKLMNGKRHDVIYIPCESSSVSDDGDGAGATFGSECFLFNLLDETLLVGTGESDRVCLTASFSPNFNFDEL
jgi:hypothetical protein